MDDRTLADAIVEIGVLQKRTRYPGYALATRPKSSYTAEQIVRDWRVAGAMMEKMMTDGPDDLRTVMGSYHPTMSVFEASVAKSAVPVYGTYLDRSDESLPRAINLACVEALGDRNG